MPVVPDKYRGTTTYHLAHAELIAAARYRGTLTYQELAQIVGLPLTGNYMGREIGQLLGEISEDEHVRGRPMLSALAVGVSGVPGDGFFTLARDLGKPHDDSAEGRRELWEQERNAVHETWRRKSTDDRA